MSLKTEKAGSRAVPRTHRGESRQGIPGRVALQQSPLALPLPGSLCHNNLRSPRKFQRTATVEIPRVSRKGSPHTNPTIRVHHFSSLSTRNSRPPRPRQTDPPSAPACSRAVDVCGPALNLSAVSNPGAGQNGKCRIFGLSQQRAQLAAFITFHHFRHPSAQSGPRNERKQKVQHEPKRPGRPIQARPVP